MLLVPGAAAADLTTRALPRAYTAMTLGPDGNLWLGDSVLPGHLARISPGDGAYTEWTLDDCSVRHLAAGPDGNVWVACDGIPAGMGFPSVPAKLVRVTTSGAMTGFLASGGGADRIGGLAAGADGKLWYTVAPQFGVVAVRRMTTAGTVDGTFTNPALREAGVIVAGADGAMWAAGFRRLHRVASDGSMTHVGVHDDGQPSGPEDFNNDPQYLLAGPDGALYTNLWHPSYLQTWFARVTADARIAAQVPWPAHAHGFIDGMANAPGGAIWASAGTKLHRVDLAGQSLAAYCPGRSGGPGQLTPEPNGALWFLSTTYRANFVDRDTLLGRLDPDTPAGSGCSTSPPPGAPPPSQPPPAPGQGRPTPTLGLEFARTPLRQRLRDVIRRGLRTGVRLDRAARVTYTLRPARPCGVVFRPVSAAARGCIPAPVATRSD